MLDFNALRTDHQILKGRYRVRLLKKESVPVICDIKGVDENVLLIDLPEAEGYEAKVLEAHKELQQVLTERSSGSLEEDKENLPSGYEKASENLQVTFLSIEKLDKIAATNRTRMEENGFEIKSLDRFVDFDLHMVPQREAHELINDLSLDGLSANDHKQFTLIIFTEGSGHQNVLFFGLRRTAANELSTFKGRYMGDFYSSINRLDHLNSCLKSIEAKCHCRFDVLRESVLVEKSGNFIPAQFTIEADWAVDEGTSARKETSKNARFYDYLQMPPNKATVSIKFKPGWKDARVALTDRINELRYLAELATHFKEGTLPWTGPTTTNQEQQQMDVNERLKELVASAKNKLDAQSVYPFDFTDRLWDVLKTTRSMDILRGAFQLIYDQLQSGEFLVLVEANKVSSLAKMLRVRNPAELIFPRLEPMICLQFLIEIGLDRFNGELAYRFFSGHLIPNSFDLDPFFLPATKPLESRIERLLPLHLALQSMVMLQQYVKFPQHEKANVAKRLLTHFTAMTGTEAFEKEFVHKATMEDINRKMIDDTMTDWILERKCHSPSPFGTSSSTLDAVHITKNFGLKYMRPPIWQQREEEEMEKTTIVVKSEHGGEEDRNAGGDDGNNNNKEEAAPPQFECLYLTIANTQM